jgi:hypothetical protein
MRKGCERLYVCAAESNYFTVYNQQSICQRPVKTEADFLYLIGTTDFRVFSLLFTVTSTNGYYCPFHLSKSGLKLVCNVSTVYGNNRLTFCLDSRDKSRI